MSLRVRPSVPVDMHSGRTRFYSRLRVRRPCGRRSLVVVTKPPGIADRGWSGDYTTGRAGVFGDCDATSTRRTRSLLLWNILISFGIITPCPSPPKSPNTSPASESAGAKSEAPPRPPPPSPTGKKAAGRKARGRKIPRILRHRHNPMQFHELSRTEFCGLCLQTESASVILLSSVTHTESARRMTGGNDRTQVEKVGRSQP